MNDHMRTITDIATVVVETTGARLDHVVRVIRGLIKKNIIKPVRDSSAKQTSPLLFSRGAAIEVVILLELKRLGLRGSILAKVSEILSTLKVDAISSGTQCYLYVIVTTPYFGRGGIVQSVELTERDYSGFDTHPTDRYIAIKVPLRDRIRTLTEVTSDAN